MKNLIFILFAFMLSFAGMAFAAGGHDHGPVEKTMGNHSGHDSAIQGEHDGMVMNEGMVMLGSQVNQGVKGMAHLNDVRLAMAKAGMNFTHHFMIAFVEEKSGVQLEQGTVALKVIDPDDKVMETVELLGMSGHFGVDVALTKEGEYHFMVGSKLADGANRKYHFHQVNKY